MDRHTDRQTHRGANDWQHGRSDRWDDRRSPDWRTDEDGEPPSRPLLDRLTQAGGGRWVPMSGRGLGRER